MERCGDRPPRRRADHPREGTTATARTRGLVTAAARAGVPPGSPRCHRRLRSISRCPGAKCSISTEAHRSWRFRDIPRAASPCNSRTIARCSPGTRSRVCRERCCSACSTSTVPAPWPPSAGSPIGRRDRLQRPRRTDPHRGRKTSTGGRRDPQDRPTRRETVRGGPGRGRHDARVGGVGGEELPPA
jgi:hypothetical protein